MSEPKKLTVWNFDTDEIEEMVMDEDDYQKMVEYEEQLEFEAKLRRERAMQEEWDILQYAD